VAAQIGLIGKINVFFYSNMFAGVVGAAHEPTEFV
jgi:hypothetical protein